MMEPADFGNFYDSSQLRRLNLSRLRRVLFQGEMSPGIEIVAEVTFKNAAQMFVVNDDHVV